MQKEFNIHQYPNGITLLHKQVLSTRIAHCGYIFDIGSRDEKVGTLIEAFSINDQLGNGQYDILIVDDLFDTGSSLEAATTVLRGYNKIRNIYVATVTRKR